MTQKEIDERIQRARERRYKKACVKQLSMQAMTDFMWEAQEECEAAQYWEGADLEDLIDALDGNEEEASEFQLLFADLSSEVDRFQRRLDDCEVNEHFDDWFVAMAVADGLGGMYGWDDYEEDWFTLDWEDPAIKAARDRLERLTKRDLIRTGQECTQAAFAFMRLQEKYSALEDSLKILKAQNEGYSEVITALNELYEKAAEKAADMKKYGWGQKQQWDTQEGRQFNHLLESLPDTIWVQ